MALCEPLTPTHRQPEKSSENYSVQHYHDFEIHGGSFNSKILKESTMAFRRSESSVLPLLARHISYGIATDAIFDSDEFYDTHKCHLHIWSANLRCA